MQNRNVITGVVALVGLLAVLLTVVTFNMSGIDGPDAAFEVREPVLRATLPDAPTAAAFMSLANNTGQDDRLLSARSDIAERVELHTHDEDANGVMRMSRIEGGIDLPDGAAHLFQRGGDHLMFMGLSTPLTDGESVEVTLTFEQAGDVVITVPVAIGR